jgi:hypothetical protein
MYFIGILLLGFGDAQDGLQQRAAAAEEFHGRRIRVAEIVGQNRPYFSRYGWRPL